MTGIMMNHMSHKLLSGPSFDFYNPPQLVGASFNGTTQNLSVPNSATLNPGYGDFTIEFWTRLTSTTNNASFYGGGGGAGVDIFMNGAGRLTFGQGQISPLIIDTVAMTTGAWVHVAAVRISNVTRLYKNGVLLGAVGDYRTYVTDIANYIGRGDIGYGGTRINGYMSNLRVVIGTGVYTDAFTPPTKPLQPITNTAFFAALGVSPFVDSSSNALTITNTGTVPLVDSSPFSATWTDSVSGIVATVAGAAQFGNNNPTYDPRFGGGLMFGESPRQTYVDVPTAYTRPSGGAFTISLAAQIPTSNSNGNVHYVAIFCSNTAARSGNGIMSRHWTGDGLEFGHTSNWLTGGFLTMGQLAWYDYVYSADGTTVELYKNGASVTSGSVSGAVTGWLNPLRFGGDEAISGANANTMATGVMYRMKCQPQALSAGQVTTQFNAVRATYGL